MISLYKRPVKRFPKLRFANAYIPLLADQNEVEKNVEGTYGQDLLDGVVQ